MNDHRLESQLQRIRSEHPDQHLDILAAAISNEVPAHEMGAIIKKIKEIELAKSNFEEEMNYSIEEYHNLRRT